MSIIECDTIAELIEFCAGLVREGIAFKADTRTLKITCTGY